MHNEDSKLRLALIEADLEVRELEAENFKFDEFSSEQIVRRDNLLKVLKLEFQNELKKLDQAVNAQKSKHLIDDDSILNAHNESQALKNCIDQLERGIETETKEQHELVEKKRELMSQMEQHEGLAANLRKKVEQLQLENQKLRVHIDGQRKTQAQYFKQAEDQRISFEKCARKLRTLEHLEGQAANTTCGICRSWLG